MKRNHIISVAVAVAAMATILFFRPKPSPSPPVAAAGTAVPGIYVTSKSLAPAPLPLDSAVDDPIVKTLQQRVLLTVDGQPLTAWQVLMAQQYFQPDLMTVPLDKVMMEMAQTVADQVVLAQAARSEGLQLGDDFQQRLAARMQAAEAKRATELARYVEDRVLRELRQGYVRHRRHELASEQPVALTPDEQRAARQQRFRSSVHGALRSWLEQTFTDAEVIVDDRRLSDQDLATLWQVLFPDDDEAAAALIPAVASSFGDGPWVTVVGGRQVFPGNDREAPVTARVAAAGAAIRDALLAAYGHQAGFDQHILFVQRAPAGELRRWQIETGMLADELYRRAGLVTTAVEVSDAEVAAYVTAHRDRFVNFAVPAAIPAAARAMIQQERTREARQAYLAERRARSAIIPSALVPK